MSIGSADRLPLAVAEVAAVLVSVGARAAVITDHASVAWLGEAPGLVDATVVVVDAEVIAVPPGHAGLSEVERILSARLGREEPVAVETRALPASLEPAFAGHPLVDVAAALEELRLSAHEQEILGIRRAAELASRAQDTLREVIEIGISEQELWSGIGRTIGATSAVVDLMFGDRCEQIGLPPTDRRLTSGETVIFDYAPLTSGWWGDSCSTTVLGPVPVHVRRAHDTARRALDVVSSMLRAGAVVGQLDRVARDVLRAGGYRCPHHIGHGIGYKQQDFPFFSTTSEARLEVGTVIAVEPGAYGPGFGVRVEHLYLIGERGAEQLTTHDLTLGPGAL